MIVRVFIEAVFITTTSYIREAIESKAKIP